MKVLHPSFSSFMPLDFDLAIRYIISIMPEVHREVKRLFCLDYLNLLSVYLFSWADCEFRYIYRHLRLKGYIPLLQTQAIVYKLSKGVAQSEHLPQDVCLPSLPAKRCCSIWRVSYCLMSAWNKFIHCIKTGSSSSITPEENTDIISTFLLTHAQNNSHSTFHITFLIQIKSDNYILPLLLFKNFSKLFQSRPFSVSQWNVNFKLIQSFLLISEVSDPSFLGYIFKILLEARSETLLLLF